MSKDAFERQRLDGLMGKRESFYIGTCLRNLWLTDDENLVQKLSLMGKGKFEVYRHREAYQFLLQVLCGLESTVKGETEILGQFKAAWRLFICEESDYAKSIQQLIDKLFKDTKEIRTKHIEGMGGASYGSLTRNILNADTKDQILLIGAGKLAHAVAPFFVKMNLSVWNRGKDRLVTLVNKMSRHDRLINAVDDSNLASVIYDTKHLVICTPICCVKEKEWASIRRKTAHTDGIVVHLGARYENASHWHGVRNFYSLTKVLALQVDRSELVERRVRDAFLACEAKAKQRFMMREADLFGGTNRVS